MKNHISPWFVSLVVFAIGIVRADEIDVPMGQLPSVVQEAMKKLAGNGEIQKTTRETEKDGTVIFEVAYTAGGKKFEAEISPEGKTIVVDEQMKLDQTPGAVSKLIKEKTAGGTIGKIEKATKGNEVFYEVEFKRDGKEREVKISPHGKLIAEE